MSDVTVNETALGTATVDERQGEPCPGCRRPLPIRATKSGEAGAHWECAACHTSVTGILLKDVAANMADSIRFGHMQLDTSGVPPIPLRLRQLVKEFVDSRRRNPSVDERRKLVRVPIELDVTTLLLDESWNPRARPLMGIGIDLTLHGLGMVTTSPVESKFVTVEFRLPTGVVQILCQVVWTKDIGHGFFNSGLQFLLRFGRCATICVPATELPSTN